MPGIRFHACPFSQKTPHQCHHDIFVCPPDVYLAEAANIKKLSNMNYYEDLSKHRSPEQILTNLREFSERYLRMIKVDFEYFDIKKNFTRINEIGGQVAYPYLLEVLTDYDNGVISTDALNIILKTVFDYLNKGNEFDFTILSELINQRLVIRNL